MGDRELTTRHSAVARHRLRIRTIAVTFAAAVRSAHHDLEVGPAERDALVEAWRAWSIDVLDGYSLETGGVVGPSDSDARDAIERELEAAYRIVRGA